jgi:hypothetical protein
MAARTVPRGLPAEFATRAAQSRAVGPDPEAKRGVDGASTSRTMPAVVPGERQQPAGKAAGRSAGRSESLPALGAEVLSGCVGRREVPPS